MGLPTEVLRPTPGPFRYLMGTDRESGEAFHLTDDDLAVHLAVLGGSGSGKSKFLERLCRCRMEARLVRPEGTGGGFCLIDPHGDLSEDLLAYAAYRQRVTDAMSRLRAQRDEHADGDFFAWARGIAARNRGELGAVAMKFISDSSKRRELLTHMRARGEAVEALIRQELAINPDARIILFHESIVEVEALFLRLADLGFKAIAEHSDLPNSHREEGLELFRKGEVQIIVSRGR